MFFITLNANSCCKVGLKAFDREERSETEESNSTLPDQVLLEVSQPASTQSYKFTNKIIGEIILTKSSKETTNYLLFYWCAVFSDWVEHTVIGCMLFRIIQSVDFQFHFILFSRERPGKRVACSWVGCRNCSSDKHALRSKPLECQSFQPQSKVALPVVF